MLNRRRQEYQETVLMGINGIANNDDWGKWVDLWVEFIGGGGAFTIRIWAKGNIREMGQQGVGANTASCIGTT
jgi:hypothetical protein